MRSLTAALMALLIASPASATTNFSKDAGKKESSQAPAEDAAKKAVVQEKNEQAAAVAEAAAERVASETGPAPKAEPAPKKRGFWGEKPKATAPSKKTERPDF